MLSTLFAAWRNLVKRLAADWLILTAAGVTITLSTILLASGPIYADAVTLSALQRTLDTAAVTDANALVEQRSPPELYELADELVVETAKEAFQATGVELLRQIESESFQFNEADSEGIVDLAVFRYLEAVESHATLLQGSWPKSTDGEAQVALLDKTAEMTGLNVGDQIVLPNRLDDALVVQVSVVGVYQVDDPTDPYWLVDELALEGMTRQVSFRTYGPFVVDRDTMFDQITRDRLHSGWLIIPRHENLTVAEIPSQRRRIASLEEDLRIAFLGSAGAAAVGASEFVVQTGLPDLLAETERSLTVTRSSVLALLAQLAILAGYALVLSAGLLIEVRRTESNLLRSRGSSPGQILMVAIFEGVMLTVPAAVVAPWLASRLLEAIDGIGPLASIGLNISAHPNPEAYVLAGLAALGSVIALSWPAYRAARSFPESARKHRRQIGSSRGQRAGVDIALLAVAVLGFWQLQSLGPQISATVRGRFGVDPLLVVAPAMGLLAGAVLALRVIPMLARVAERIASSGRSTVSALSAWQVARRPVRYARSALLLIMAIGIGFFAATYSTTWLQSQEDQAAFQVGADVNLAPNRRTGQSIPDLYLPTSHETIPNVITSMPVVRKIGQFVLSGDIGQFVFVDAARASEVVNIRSDLSPGFDSLMNQMASSRPEMAVVPLPDEPELIGLDFRVSEVVPTPENFLGPGQRGYDLRLSVVLQDGDGLLHKVRLGSIPSNDGMVRMHAELSFPLNPDTRTKPRFPLSVVDIEVLSPTPTNGPHQLRVEFGGIFVGDSVTSWTEVDTAIAQAEWEVSSSEVAGVQVQPSIDFSPRQPDDALALEVHTGASFGSLSVPVYFGIRPRGTALPDSFPILVTESFLESNALEPGDTVRIAALGSIDAQARVIGTLESFPTVDPEVAEAVLIDLATSQMLGYQTGSTIDNANEYWLDTTGENDSESIKTVLGPDFESVRAESRANRVQTLTSDPIALGATGALTLGFVAAAVFATVGFAVSATVSARERLTEFALLRALGLSPKQLGSWLSLEQGVLVAASLALGTLIGAVLTATILPLVSLTQSGANAVPGVEVIYPWTTIIQLDLAVLTVLGLMVLVMTFLLRRLGLGSLLRLGED